jgi:ArsR family transcriptional regulator
MRNNKKNTFDRLNSDQDHEFIAVDRLAETFRVLGDSSKLRICMLLTADELPVCEIAQKLDLSESAVSHSLRILRSLRLVRYRRQGRKIFYALDDEHVRELIEIGREHVEEEKR